MTPAEARRFVLMDLLDRAATQAEAWHEAARRSPAAAPIAAAWDNTRETLLASITKHDRDNPEIPTAALGNTRAGRSKENAA
jgi:hypothetical protein